MWKFDSPSVGVSIELISDCPEWRTGLVDKGLCASGSTWPYHCVLTLCWGRHWFWHSGPAPKGQRITGLVVRHRFWGTRTFKTLSDTISPNIARLHLIAWRLRLCWLWDSGFENPTRSLSNQGRHLSQNTLAIGFEDVFWSDLYFQPPFKSQGAALKDVQTQVKLISGLEREPTCGSRRSC